MGKSNKKDERVQAPAAKVLAVVGIVAVVAYMTYFAVRPFSFILFMLGFLVIYLVFVFPLRFLRKME